jgi:hypothetical protein
MGLSRDLSARQIAGLSDDNEAIERVRVRVLPDGRLDRSNAARYLGCAAKTLAMWAFCGRGPRMVKVGGRAFYYKDELDRFIRGEMQ